MNNKINNLLQIAEEVLNNKEQLTDTQIENVKEVVTKLISATKEEFNWADYSIWN